MARMHSGKRGNSGSTRPLKRTVPSWVQYKPTEVEMLIAKMAKDGMLPSKIGMVLRDKYGIPDVKPLCKKTISQIMADKKVSSELPEDLICLIRQYAKLKKHMEENNHDMTAKRGLQLTDAKIKRLIKYYKNSGKVAEEWTFDESRVGFFLE